MLADLQPGAASSAPAELTRAFGRWFFSADDGASGRELYVTDGTSAGTIRVADVCAGIHHGVGTIAPCGVGRLVVFEGGCANDIGLWVSDGTPAGTRRVADAVPGARRVDVTEIVTAGDTTYYAADDGVIGVEPYAIPLRVLGGSQAEPYGAGCPGSTGVRPRIGGSDVPFAGSANFAVELTGVRAGAAAIAIIGLARANSPYPGGCRLYIAGFIASSAVVVANASGIASFPIPVPANPALIGASVFFQGVMDDPGGAYFGLGALSDGLHVVVGS